MIRFAIIGIGRRGLNHLETLRKFKNAEVVAVCDVSEARLKEVSEKYKVKPYKSVDEMLNKEKINVAVIATPVIYHVPIALKCVEHGLDLMLEKPVSLSLKELKELLKAVNVYDVIAAVGFQTKYTNLVDVIKEELKHSIVSMIAGHWYWTIPPIAWIRDRNLAGGQVVEQAIHLVDLYRYFIGEINEVYAAYTEKGRDTEEEKKIRFNNWASCVVAFKFDNNCIGTLYCTYALYPKIFIDGKGEHVMIDIICREKLIRYYYCKEVRIYERGKDVRVYTLSDEPTYRMYDCFIKAVETRDKSLLRTSYDDAFMTNVVVLAANKSAIEGRIVKIKEFLREE